MYVYRSKDNGIKIVIFELSFSQDKEMNGLAEADSKQDYRSKIQNIYA